MGNSPNTPPAPPDNTPEGRLKSFFLSPKASTEKDDTKEPIQEFNETQIVDLLTQNVPGITSMMDRTGSVPVCQYIVSTYISGLPIFESNSSVQQHTIQSLKYIIYKASTLKNENQKKQVLKRLAEAFTACQMEQGRVVDSLYGSLSGREKSFRDQILNMVDIQKEQVMNQLINKSNPDAWKTGDDNPSGQLPHIQSSYCKSFGEELGIRGWKAAKLDKDKSRVSSEDKKKIDEEFYRFVFYV
jgi:hypothetical protein